jgi:hypothetical protein
VSCSVYRQGRYAAGQEICLHHFHTLLARTMAPHLDMWDAQHGRGATDGNGNGTHAGLEQVAR